MRWHQQIASALRRIGVTAVAVVGLVPSTGWAQSQYDMFGSGAAAVAAYEASKDQCIYSNKMEKALADIDAFLTRQNRDHWNENKRLAPDGLVVARNMGRSQGATDCKLYGVLIGYASIAYFNAAAFDQVVFAEFDGLLKGDGRSVSGEAEARPPQPPPPGSAADTFARMNREGSLSNNPVSQPSQDATMRRPPADDPLPRSSRSQPAPRQSAEPSPRRVLARPVPVAQTTPSVSPPPSFSPPPSVPTPSLASPNAATQPSPAQPVLGGDQKPTPEFLQCMEAVDLGAFKNTQFAGCYAGELARQDARLNAAYNQLRAKLRASGTSALTQGQRAWIGYRDTWCSFEGQLDQAPSNEVNKLDCLARETRSQASRLQSLQLP